MYFFSVICTLQIFEYIQLLARLLEHAVLQGQCHEIVTSQENVNDTGEMTLNTLTARHLL
jgi:hypothetical protein